MNDLSKNPKVKAKIDFFSAWVESQMAYKQQPAISVGLIHDQDLFWSKGFGLADIESQKSATEQTIYRIASITKLFTSTAVLQLRDAGKLRLDDPVKQYLPWFEMKSEHEDDSPVLIRHLLTHTSGLPREAKAPYWDTADFPEYEKVKQLLPDQTKIWSTETRWKYSNLGLSLAGMIVAAVSGMEYESYIDENILKPLGMDNTHVRTLDPQNPLFATGYGRRMPDNSRSMRPFGDCKGISPAANMATNVEDLAEFAMLQFRDGPAGGNQILKGSTLREMHTLHWMDESWQSGWGWGFMVMRIGKKTMVGHGGSLMGYRTSFLLDPKDKFGAIVLTNSDDGDPALYAEKIFEWVAPEVSKVVVKKDEKKPDISKWQKFIGKYRSAWGDTQIMLQDGELVAVDPSLADPTLDICKLVPKGENLFQMKMKSGFGAPDELAWFELDEAGEVIRLHMGDGYCSRVKNW